MFGLLPALDWPDIISSSPPYGVCLLKQKCCKKVQICVQSKWLWPHHAGQNTARFVCPPLCLPLSPLALSVDSKRIQRKANEIASRERIVFYVRTNMNAILPWAKLLSSVHIKGVSGNEVQQFLLHCGTRLFGSCVTACRLLSASCQLLYLKVVCCVNACVSVRVPRAPLLHRRLCTSVASAQPVCCLSPGAQKHPQTLTSCNLHRGNKTAGRNTHFLHKRFARCVFYRGE